MQCFLWTFNQKKPEIKSTKHAKDSQINDQQSSSRVNSFSTELVQCIVPTRWEGNQRVAREMDTEGESVGAP